MLERTEPRGSVRPYRLMTPRLPIASFAALAAVLLSSPAHATQAGFAFLEIPAGARASAMGGAYASVAQGVEAAFWNPAGLTGVEGLQMTGTHYELVGGLRAAQFAVAGKVYGGGLSGSVRALYSEPIPERDALGNLIGTFGSHDIEFGLGYGYDLGGGFGAGATVQLIRERIADNSATTYAFGAGMTWEPPPFDGVRLSGSVHNLGPATNYDFDGIEGAAVNLPFAVQMGGSYTFAFGNMWRATGALEGRLTRGREGMGLIGAEIATVTGMALRAGYRGNDDAQRFSFGAGYALDALSVDYAFIPLDYELGDSHRFSFSAQF